MGFFKSIGRKISSSANKAASGASKFGTKAGNDISKFGKKAGGVGKQVAGGISQVNAVVQKVAPMIAPLAGPYAPAVLGAAAGLDTLNSGIHSARTLGASAVKHGEKRAKEIKDLAIATGKHHRRQLESSANQLVGTARTEVERAMGDINRGKKQVIEFAGEQIAAIPRPARPAVLL